MVQASVSAELADDTDSSGFDARSTDDPLAQLANTNPTKLPTIARDIKFITACSCALEANPNADDLAR